MNESAQKTASYAARKSQAENGDYLVYGEVAEHVNACLHAGREPDIEALVAPHPELASQLREMVGALVMLHHLGARPEAENNAASVSASVPPAFGQLGDFHIVREIGRGGMGVVYEAVQLSLGRRVALKMLPFAAAMDPNQLQRFKNEAQAAAHLQHTNIVPVYYVGCERGVHFYAMQFIEGQTLATLIGELRQLTQPEPARPAPDAQAGSALVRELASGRWAPVKHNEADPHPTTDYVPAALPAEPATVPRAALSTERSIKNPAFFRTVAHLGVQAAEAVEHAHQLGVIHRDIKPANLLVDAGGRLWITDFGLAHCQSQPGLTMTGDLLGTLRYMSPEQALAKRVTVDARTDVYSLGVTLYELLTLEPAYNGRTREEVLRQIAFEEPRLPSRWNQAVPAELEIITWKAMAKNPDERYATAQELADDLRRYLEDKPIKAKRPSLRQRAVKWARRHKTVVRAALVVLLLALVGLAVSFAFIWQANQDLLRTLYFERIARADREWSANNLREVEHLLDACPVGLRGWEWDYLKRLRLPGILPLRHSAAVFAAVFSPDGKWIASGDQDGVVKIWDASTGQLADTFQAHQWHVRSLAFSTDGGLLATASWDHTAKVWQVDPERAGEKHVLLHTVTAKDRVHCVTFSPDNQLWVGTDKNMRIWDVATGRESEVLPGYSGVIWSPDGHYLASTINDGRAVRIWDPRTGREKPLLQHHAPVMSISFSRDGRWFASSSGEMATQGDGTIHVWHTRTGAEVRTLRGHTSYIWRVIFSPDGQRLVSGGADENVKLWDLETGQELLSLRGHRGPIRDLDFSPDGTRLISASQDHTVRLWDARPLGTETGQELVTLVGHHAGVRSVAFSPDGRWLASVANDGKVLIWDQQRARAGGTKLLVRSLDGCPGFRHVVFSHNGHMLASAGSDRAEGNLKVWDTTTWKVLFAPAIAAGAYSGVAFSADDKYLAVPNADDNFRVDILDLTTGQVIHRLPGHTWAVWVLACSPNPDVPRLASAGGDGTVRIWDMKNGKLIVDPLRHSDGVAAVGFSHDGQLLASGGNDRIVKVWATETGELRYQRSDPTGCVASVVFHPHQSRVLAWGSHDGTVKIWDIAADEIQTLHGHTSWVEGVAFSRNGDWIASASLDGTIKLWQVPFGRQIRGRAAAAPNRGQ